MNQHQSHKQQARSFWERAWSGSKTFEIVLKGDINGDSKVNVADIVKAINDGKPQADIDDIVKIIFGK